VDLTKVLNDLADVASTVVAKTQSILILWSKLRSQTFVLKP